MVSNGHGVISACRQSILAWAGARGSATVKDRVLFRDPAGFRLENVFPMADVGFELVFLADRLTSRDELRALRVLTDGLGRLGHVCRVFCTSAPPGHGIADLSEVPGLSRRWLLSWTARGLTLDDPPARPRILHVLKSRLADAAVEVAERWRIPYLLTVDEFPGRDGRLRLSRNWCRGLVATNRELAEALIVELGVPPRFLQTIERGVPDPVESTRLAATGPRVPVVGAAGPLVPGSGFATFLNAARKVIDTGVDAEFLIAGDGDEVELRRRADRLKIADRLTFAEDLSADFTFWDVLDVYCQTSVVPTSGRPLALAMAHGIPAIASDIQGLRSLVEPGVTGLRIPHGDASALADAILHLLSDPDHARSLGDAARSRILPLHRASLEVERLDQAYRTIAQVPSHLHPASTDHRASDATASRGLDARDTGDDSRLDFAD
jgi:glycosyltransferase involved in cell wall biosynthesis